jgi:hypothetical protein
MTLYTLSIGHLDAPAAEIFRSERAALRRRLSLSEVGSLAARHILNLFDLGEREAYEAALNRLESEVGLVCAIEEHEIARV